MKIFKKLFGKQNDDSENTFTHEGKMISLYDSNGNQFQIAKSEYLKKVLPEKFETVKNNADELYNLIILTLQDGFFEECLLPARQLSQIQPDNERSITILGIALMKNKFLDDAQELFENYLKQNSDSDVILTNLAKVFAEKGEEERSIQTLWKSLTINPNQDNAVDWWGAIHSEKKGENGFYEAMEQLAQLPGSWRPQLWLARRLLEQKKINAATTIYQKVLESEPEDENALMMISGDLGNGGYIIQMLDLVLPFYKPEKHGAMAGLNLVQACMQLRNKKTGLMLCDSLYKLQRYDMKQYIEQLREQLIKL
jgi:tetratricopeptide (TPR) repeat protein